MDIAKRLVDWTERPPEQWVNIVNRYLRPAVTAALVVTLAYQLAGITWSLVPSAPPTLAPARPAAIGHAQPADLSSLTNAHLFGESREEIAPVVTTVDAPDTSLSLSLTGILAGGPKGQAIISANRGAEKTYRVGDTVDSADGAILHAVEPDRVLLNRGGSLEALRLPEQVPRSDARSMTSAAPSAAAAPAAAPDQLANVNAALVMEVFSPQPFVQDGQVIGFRVNPGEDPTTFDALGLQPGDVVTNINGTALNNPSRSLRVFESLGESMQANMTVLRDGAPKVLVVDTTRLTRLQ